MLTRTRALALPFLLLLTAAAPPERQRWEALAKRVTITRDDWGIAHVRGARDADAVFGMMYAQAEDDFPRIEANYLAALGRSAEAEGETAIWRDLRARLYVSEHELKAHYARSPKAMRDLMDAWAAGLNHYLATHLEVRPKVLTRFEPWMALSFTEGSIGGDIERIDPAKLEAFYGGTATQQAALPDGEPRGSNGIAIAPRLTATGHALLLINPHTSFFFRSEQQVTSGEGLNAYGASTWGQFFIYQGFNPQLGWMHTSSGVDSVDEFSFDVRRGERPVYRFGAAWRPLQQRPVTIRFRTADGSMASRTFRTWRTHRGPIVRAENGRWVAFAMMDRPVEALQQSYLRTKARDLSSFLKVSDFKANSSNNTLVATAKGEIAYLHPQFVPRRDDRFDYSGVVDGSDPATDWRGMHSASELPNALNPATGWVQNTNAWPFRAAGSASPDPRRFPRYMDTFGENYRGIHAQQLLTNSQGWTLEKLRVAAFDSYQPGFAELVPQLVKAHDAAPRPALAAPIEMLRRWDRRWSADSVAPVAGDVLGRGAAEEAATASERSPQPFFRAARQRHIGRAEAGRACRGDRSADPRLRAVAGGVGGDQSLPAHLAGDRPSLQRCGTEHSAPLRVGHLGLARVGRVGPEAGHEALVRDERKQLRRRGRVRATGARGRDHGRR